jgi:hypothetical protein
MAATSRILDGWEDVAKTNLECKRPRTNEK